MVEPTRAQLNPLAKLLFTANKRGFLVAIEQISPRYTISLWMGDKSRLWCEIAPDGTLEFSREK